MELNAEQIIKALEWCSELRLCVDCPMRAEGYFSHSGNACRQALMKNALALIKELTEENERLRDKLERTDRALIVMDKAHNKLFTESFKIKADTVRKMQEALEQRIHSKLSYHGWYLKETVIAEIAKELLEGDQ
jgi:hypothetical protein